MPVSTTSKRSHSTPAVSSSTATFISTRPRSVNFTALCSRFTSSWRSRTGSPSSRSGTCGGTRWLRETGLSRTVADIRSTASAMMARRSKLVVCSVSLPASIRDRSSRSSNKVSSAVAE